ncbi:hypothetical protein LCGC14_1726240 [marine sediment metagenome]|uniref:Amidohydrolase-related domain-containing protein n=1 Tax=marine sediment metagenome TaxID=412755 RepID=A0A0F9HYM2_9ZZZZ
MRKINAHVHILGPKKWAVALMDRHGIEKVVNISFSYLSSWARLKRYEDLLTEDMDRFPGRFLLCSSFNCTHLDKGDYGERVIRKLSKDWPDGTTPVVKVWKDIGMMLKDKDGTYVLPDDKRFSPVYAWLSKRRAIVFAHFADPIQGWLPLDPKNVYYEYFKNHPRVHVYDRPGVPSHAEIIAARDRLMERWPRIRWVACHLASLEHDLDALAKFLDDHPHVQIDTAARHRDLMRFPKARVRKFFVRYQDRILFGTDGSLMLREPKKNVAKWKVRRSWAAHALARAVQYYEHDLGLSEKVKRKFFYDNAAKLLLGDGEEGP